MFDACWSSKSVGTYIRGDELPHELKQALGSAPDVNGHVADAAPGTSLDAAGHLERVAREVLDDVSRYLVKGNTIVFAEVGSVFHAFADRFPPAAPRDDRALEAFVAALTPGDAQPDRVDVDPVTRQMVTAQQGGQGWLADASR